MFLRYFDFVFAPFRAVYNKWIGIKNIRGNIGVDIKRVKMLKQRGKNFAGDVKNFQQKHGPGGAQDAQQQGAQGAQQPQYGQQPAYQQQPAGQQAYGQP